MASGGEFTGRGSCDAVLVAAARHGSRPAFDALIDRHYPPILRTLLRHTGDRDLSADLAQDTFLDAFRNLRRLEDDRTFALWLYAIARNNLRAALRRQRLRQALSLDWLLGRVAAGHDLASVGAALGRPDSSGECQERDHIQRVLDGMSPALREPLLLSSVMGYTGEEIAQILGITPAAVRQRIGRAKAQFKERYGAMGGNVEAISV